MDSTEQLARVLIDLAHHGIARCGAGFGQYPLGVREALRQLQPLADTDAVREAIKRFDERLAQ